MTHWTDWFHWFPTINFLLLVVVAVHLYRTSNSHREQPPTCIITGKSTCLLLSNQIDELDICADCRIRLRQRAGAARHHA